MAISILILLSATAFFRAIRGATFVFNSVNLGRNALTIRLVIFPFAFMEIACVPFMDAMSIALIVFPVAFMGNTTYPHGYAITFLLSVLRTTRVLITTDVMVGTLSNAFALGVEAFMAITNVRGMGAFTVLRIILPIACMFIAINVFGDSFAIPSVVFPLSIVFKAIVPNRYSFTIFLIVLPQTCVLKAILPNVHSLTFAFVVRPITLVGVAVMVMRNSFAILMVLGPRTIVAIIVRGVMSAPAVLLILGPLPLVLFAIKGRVYAMTFALTLRVLALMSITILRGNLPLSVKLTPFCFANVSNPIVFRHVNACLCLQERYAFRFVRGTTFFFLNDNSALTWRDRGRYDV